jgi:hypothetical protein
MRELLQSIGINIAISVAGLFGSLLMIGKQASHQWKTTFFSIISGVASANYLTPVILDITNMSQKYEVSIGFIMGFLGLKGVEMVSKKLIKEKENGSSNSN